MRRKAKRKPKRKAEGARVKARSSRYRTSRKSRDTVDTLIAGSALGLRLDPTWEAAIKFNLQLILSHAAAVEEFALPEDIEPAAVFHA